MKDPSAVTPSSSGESGALRDVLRALDAKGAAIKKLCQRHAALVAKIAAHKAEIAKDKMPATKT